jgi:hypothetical protein
VSTITRCNYCTLESIKAFAEQTKQEVTFKKKPIESFPDGVDVFVGGAWAVWLAKVPDHCAC